MPDPNNYSALTAAERAAEAEAAAAAAAAAQRAPIDSYNGLLNGVDLTNRLQQRQQTILDAHANNTNGFADEAEQYAHNRRWTRSLLFTLLFLVPFDAVLLLSGVAGVVVDWLFDTDTPWAIHTTAMLLSLVVWGITLGVKSKTSSAKEKARLQIATSPTEVRRLNRLIGWKVTGRAAYMALLGLGLHGVHEGVRERLEWMSRTSREMHTQAAKDQRAASIMVGGSTESSAPPIGDAGGAVFKNVSSGVEMFVLCLLWAVHGIVLVGYPSFGPVNPFGPRPFDSVATQQRLDETIASKSRMVRDLWDRLNDLPPEQRQGRVDALPVRIAMLINEEFGRNIVITNVQAQGHQPPDEPLDTSPPESPPDDEPPMSRGPFPRPRAVEDDVPAPDPMIGVV